MFFACRSRFGQCHVLFCCWVVFVFLCFSRVSADGFSSSKNFIVMVSADAELGLAQQVLTRAEEFRRDIAVEWFGETLPPSVGRAIVHVKLSTDEDKGLTWIKDNPLRRQHAVYLTTTAGNALGATLQHEIVHVVLATQFPPPKRLPAWVEEGIASRYDDDQRRETRGQVLNWIARTQNWPNLSDVLQRRVIPARDEQAYAVAASLVKFLLTQGKKKDLLHFAALGGHIGWDRAIHDSYQFATVYDLEAAWQAWIMDEHAMILAQSLR